jgi:hypothetical protein
VLGAWGTSHLFIIPNVHTQSNRVCNFHLILLWLMLPRDHTFSKFYTSRQQVAAVKGFPVAHFSVVIFFWFFGVNNARTMCCELSTTLVGARGACGMLHLFIIPPVQTQSNRDNYRVCNFHVILLWLMLSRDHFVSRLLTCHYYSD